MPLVSPYFTSSAVNLGPEVITDEGWFRMAASGINLGAWDRKRQVKSVGY